MWSYVCYALGLLFTQHYNDSYLLCYYFVRVSLFVVHIRAWTVCSYFMLGRTFLHSM